MRRINTLFPVRRDRDLSLFPFRETGLMSPSYQGASPWQMMRRMQEDVDRVFDQLLTPTLQQAQQAMQQWTPSVDISQDEKEWLIEADLPGVHGENIDVQVVDQYLVLRAELREAQPQGEAQPEQEQNGKGRHYQHRERWYGFFERVLPLPQNVDLEQIGCEFKDGVLKIHLPKTAEQKPAVRRIPIGGVQAAQPSLQAEATPEFQPGAETHKTEETAVAGRKGGEKSSRTKKAQTS